MIDPAEVRRCLASLPRVEHESPKLRVLQSFRPNASTNPYLLQLVRSLQPYVIVDTFSWRAALLARYDVLHIHWPEVLISGRTALRTAGRSVLFLLVLVVARTTRRAVVRTVHNPAPHERLDRCRRALLSLCDRWTAGWVTMTRAVEVPEPGALIPHGHYRDWYRAPAGVAPTAGRVLFFGHIRKYKGIDQLLDVMNECPDAGLTLRLVGRPQDPEVAAQVETAAAHDGRVSARLEYLDDDELAHEVTASSLTVFPYHDMVNSGAVLLALSLDRPVLVPETRATRDLQSEVGADWVMTFSPPLSSDELESAVERAATVATSGRPDLTRRDWDDVARQHVGLYVRAKHATRH